MEAPFKIEITMPNIEMQLTQAYNNLAKGRGRLPLVIIKAGQDVWDTLNKKVVPTDLTGFIVGPKTATMYLDTSLSPTDFSITLSE